MNLGLDEMLTHHAVPLTKDKTLMNRPERNNRIVGQKNHAKEIYGYDQRCQNDGGLHFWDSKDVRITHCVPKGSLQH